MNKQVINYLSQNKDNYSKESLVQQLQKAGHSQEDIQAGVGYVYGEQVDNKQSMEKRGKIASSFALVKQSFAVLKKDKEIMMFPIISTLVSIIIVITFVVPIVLFMNIMMQNTVIIYLSIFLFYTVTYFIVIFFNSGLITCAHMRLSGGNPTFKDGMSNAFAHIGPIFLWALISATVGTILQILMNQLERFGAVGQVVGHLIISGLGLVWGLLTYFVVPVIIIEDVKPGQAMKDSVELFKKTWGENLIGNFSMGIFFGLMGLLGVVPVIISIFSGSLGIIIATSVVVVLYWICLGIINASLQGIFTTALYIYAKTGKVPEAFEESVIVNAFTNKQKKKILGLEI